MKDIDYYQGFKHCLENTINHMEVAELSKTVSFGIAHAHIVLASEEAAKAIMLYNIHCDKDYLDEMKDFHLFFSNHKHKHDVIRNFEHTHLLLEKMLTIQCSPLVGIKQDSMSLYEVKQKIKEGKNNLIQWMEELSDTTNIKTTLETNDDWWREAESFKKNGFYVDLLKKRGEWSGPHKCNQNQYNKGRKIVLEFIEKVQALEEHNKNSDGERLYKKIKNGVI